IGVLNAWLKPETPPTRRRRQDIRNDIIFRPLLLALIVKVEKCFVPDDRSAYASAKLVAEKNRSGLNLLAGKTIRSGGITEPVVRIQNRVAMLFKDASVKIIRPRARYQLNLCHAATIFDVRGRCDHMDFLYAIDASCILECCCAEHA